MQETERYTAVARPAAASHPVLYFPHFNVAPFLHPVCSVRLRHGELERNYGFAVTSCCNSRSSSNSKSEYMS